MKEISFVGSVRKALKESGISKSENYATRVRGCRSWTNGYEISQNKYNKVISIYFHTSNNIPGTKQYKDYLDYYKNAIVKSLHKSAISFYFSDDETFIIKENDL